MDTPQKPTFSRSRSNFATRTARETRDPEYRRLSSLFPESPDREHPRPVVNDRLYQGEGTSYGSINQTEIGSRQTSSRWNYCWFGSGKSSRSPKSYGKPVESDNTSRQILMRQGSLTAQMHKYFDNKGGESKNNRRGSTNSRSASALAKLGTFSGVFVPTSLNVLSILMFLRFGMILGQAGFIGMLGMLVVCYLINLVTTLSLSAIATNGTVRGGGAYYLISRSLGPEFGGSIGVVFYLGFVFNTAMNAVGLIDCLKQNFGVETGNWYNWLPEGFLWQYLWGTLVLTLCTAICLAGSGLFAKCSNWLLLILMVSTLSIPFSTLFMKPFEDRRLGIQYTGLSVRTLYRNLMPQFTKGADGSQVKGKESFQDLFGILFPATGGIFAGASMSGDLQHPSKAIPKGTLWGLILTFVTYTLVILSLAASITRPSFYNNINVIQDVNMSGIVILVGEVATTAFSTLMGVIGSAKLLQALARDTIIPGLSVFGQGTKKSDEPIYAILVTWFITQLSMLTDLNEIANLITMAYLMTFLVMNLACFLLKISSAPNFRPSFHYFNWWTAAAGTVVSGATMFFVDGLYASGCVCVLIALFLIIHYTTPPKAWGDASQSLIYHQVRKYLLRLRQEHVKFWRPQILLFINEPRRQYKLIQFCNSLKKGGLFVLGHVIVTPDFGSAVPEARQQQIAWQKYIELSRIKAFVNIAISPAVEWGTRNIVLSSGLGGMRPNIVMLGAYNLNDYRQKQPLIDVPAPQPSRPASRAEGDDSDSKPRRRKPSRIPSEEARAECVLPEDTSRTSKLTNPSTYVTILEDLLLRLQINVAVAKGFQGLEVPDPKEENGKHYIDLWPIQMSAEIAEEGDLKQNVLTTNFDTYTLILQLGCILNTVPRWKKVYKLRVAVFVEYESEVEEERGRVQTLLQNLRIQAEVLVFWLASGELHTYEVIVNGSTELERTEAAQDVEFVLKDESWWQEVQHIRGNRGDLSASQELAKVEDILTSGAQWPDAAFQQGPRDSRAERFERLKKFLRKPKRRHPISGLSGLGVNLGMRTHRLQPDLVSKHEDEGSSSESEDSTDVEDMNGGNASEASAASENDIDDYEIDDGTVVPERKVVRRRSDGDSLAGPSLLERTRFREEAAKRATAPDREITALKETTDSNEQRPTSASANLLVQNTRSSQLHSGPSTPSRTPLFRHSSAPKFTSSPVPMTHVATEEGPGPSIMFTDAPSPTRQRGQSIYNRPSSSSGTTSVQQATSLPPASGFPAPQSIPLSFNDLPCRAQHLILNELMTKQSTETAVVFTTLPSPMEGTCQSERDSLNYLSDLEVLCEGLPPCLLVHSNSMTVTMNL